MEKKPKMRSVSLADLKRLFSELAGFCSDSVQFKLPGKDRFAFSNEAECLGKALNLIQDWEKAGKTTVSFDESLRVPLWNSRHTGADDAYRLVHMADQYNVKNYAVA